MDKPVAIYLLVPVMGGAALVFGNLGWWVPAVACAAVAIAALILARRARVVQDADEALARAEMEDKPPSR